MTDTSAAAAVEASAAQARPAALRPIALAMCALNGLAFFVLDPSLDSFPLTLSLTIAIVAVSLVVIWFFWRGRNWARWAVLFGSVLNLVSLGVPMDMNTGERALSVAYVALSLWLLYWLNTARVKEYFRRTPSRWTRGRTGVVIVATLAACVILFFVAVVALVLLTPTARPVYGERISASHREALRGLYPEGETLLGLYSTGVFRVTEDGCLFTDNRVVAFGAESIRLEATYSEIAGITLRRDTTFFGTSELTIRRHDGTRLYCTLPNTTSRPNDPGEFHERVTAAWRARSGAAAR